MTPTCRLLQHSEERDSARSFCRLHITGRQGSNNDDTSTFWLAFELASCHLVCRFPFKIGTEDLPAFEFFSRPFLLDRELATF